MYRFRYVETTDGRASARVIRSNTHYGARRGKRHHLTDQPAFIIAMDFATAS
jgi:hypothetical protein